MFSDASSNGAAAAAGGAAGPSDLARKLKESQDRQNVILKKIADKERQLNMQPSMSAQQLSASTSAPASNTSALNSSFAHNLSSASLPYYQGMTSALSPSAMHQQPQQPQQQQHYSFAPSASSAHIPQTLPQRSPALNGYGGGGGGDNNYLSTTTASAAAPAGLDFSMMDDRLTSTLADDESTMLRVRQLASQLRHTKSEGARKDILLANATQQISELNRLANEYAAARASWEAREQQHTLRDNEYTQTISELQQTIHSLTGAESQLRANNAAVTKEKLALERGATIQLGDLEAQVVSLRGDLAQAQQSQKSAEYETSLARRELARVQNAFQSFEQTQLSLNQAMEEKYFALKKELQHTAEKKAESQLALEGSQRRAEEMEANRDSLANEVSILTRSKQAQSGMIDSLQRELQDAQHELATLRIQVENIPALKAQALELTQTKAEHRATTQKLQALEVSAQGQAVQLAHLSAENQSLQALQASLESSLKDTRDRLQTVTGPQGELETQRGRAQFLDAELQKAQIHATNLASQLDTHKAGENQQAQNVDSVQAYITSVLNTIHRSVDASLGGAGAAEVEALEREFAAIQTPQVVKESVRGAGNNLRAGVRAVASELNHLRAQQAGLISQVESLSADATAAQQALRELDNQLQAQQAQAKSDGEAMTRLSAELAAQREANTALNQQNHTLISELDERTVVIRLWAVELENVARSLLTASAAEAGLGDSRGPGAAGGAQNTVADFDGGRSSLGAAAPLSVSEHWPSIRAAFNDILHHVQQRSKGALAELADCNRSRKQQRQDVCRLSDELAAVSAQLANTTEAAHKAARQATQALHDSESLRLTEAARVADDHRAAMTDLQTSYEKLVGDLQDNLRRSTDEIIARTQENHNQLTALRIMYKALKPLQSKLHELQIQKSVLNSLCAIGNREHAEVRALMIAMTGVATPTGVRAFVQGAKRSLFRAGVLAVLAARRFQLGPRKGAVYGRSVVIRGEQVNLIENVQLSADANIPSVDDTSLSSSAQSLLALLAHFEPFTSGVARPGANNYSANRSSLFSRLTAPTRFAPSLRAQGVAFEDSAEIAVIRRVALAMANRTKALERELALAKTDAWTAKEQSRVLIADMQATHAQLTQLHAQTLDHEKARVARLEEEHTQDLNALRRLEDQLNQMTLLKNSMVSREEFDGLRNAREELARTARDLDSQLTTLKHLNASEREKAALTLSQAIEVRENKLSAFNQRLHASADENTQLHHVIQKKTADLTTMERSLGEAASLHEDLARNLEQTLSKNQQLVDRIRVLETECQEHRLFSQKMKSVSVQFESSKAHSEATLNHLQSELREKERELQKSQEMVRTLTAATRAAANELDSQMAYSRTVVRRPPTNTQQNAGQTSQPPQQPQQQSFNPYSPSRSSRQGGGGSYIYSAAPAGQSLQQPQQSQPPPPQSQQINAGPSTIHLRHHPGGRLSMDVTRAAVSAAGLDQPPQQQQHQDFLSFQQQPRLQSSSYPHPSPSDSSQPLRFDDLPTHSGASSAPSSAYLNRHADPASSSSSAASAATQAAAPSGRVEREQ